MSDKRGEAIGGIFLGLLMAIYEGARDAKLSLKKKGPGPREDLDVRWLTVNLAETFERFTGKKPGKGRKGLFAKYFKLCLRAAGEEHADPFPLLNKALGKRPTLQDLRRERERQQSQEPSILSILQALPFGKIKR